jgi:hypothetical protein
MSQNKSLKNGWAPGTKALAFALLVAQAVVIGVIDRGAWAKDIQIRELGPGGEDLTNPGPGDDRLVAVLVYERPETTQSCGEPLSAKPVSMKLTVHADGVYTGIATTSRLDCSRRHKGVVRKAAVSRHTGKLSIPDLATFWARISDMAQVRELAANPEENVAAQGTLRIRKAEDVRGVLTDRELKEFVQKGETAESSARFLQTLIFEGKIN